MFDFAVSRNQGRPQTGRLLASWIVSCLFHFLMLLLLVEYPQLLRGGMYRHFRALSLVTSILGAKSKDEDKDWRTIAVLRNPSRMPAPSAATLKKYLYDWNKKQPGAPPVRIRWGDVKAALLDNAPPMPRVQKSAKPELTLPPNEIAAGGSTAPAAGKPADQSEPTAGNKGTVSLPPPAPAPKSEVAANNPPTKIPDSKPPSGAQTPAQKNQNSPAAVKVFENEQKAIRSPESGIFDTNGFPLGEYANLIKERIKGKWFIPSNLRNSQGHTTVVFFIDREGRFANARIVTSSGSNSLDLAALNAIMEANPFPPLPKGFPGDHVGAKFVFSYNEAP
jgi:protein TonB